MSDCTCTSAWFGPSAVARYVDTAVLKLVSNEVCCSSPCPLEQIHAGCVQHVAAGVGHGHGVGSHVGHARRDEVNDRLHGVARQGRTARRLYQYCGAGAVGFRAGEHLVGGDRQVDGRRRDTVDRLDGLLELTLHGALVVDALHELRSGDAFFVEERQVIGGAGRQALGAECDALLVHEGGGNQHGGATVGELPFHAGGVESLRDLARIGPAQARVERRVVGRARPVTERHARQHHREHAEDGHGLLAGCEAVDEVLALVADPIEVDSRHQICIAMIWLNASTARSRTATVISVCNDASVAAIV